MSRVTVIGGGIVGCHIALEFSRRGWEVFLLEKNPGLGRETSSRNSGVLHAGIYYRPDSLKARLCVEGNRLSREFFDTHGVRYKSSGKFIISRNSVEEQELWRLYDTALQNGAEVTMVAGSTVTEAIAYVRCTCAIHSPFTAVIDTADYLGVLKSLLYRNNVHTVLSCTAVNIASPGIVDTDRGIIESDLIINSAGLHADELARDCGLGEYTIVPLKGDYYCTLDIPLALLVYPVPNRVHHTLGLHLTPTFGKEVLVGPSETASKGKSDYSIQTPREEFENSLRSMFGDTSAVEITMYEGYSGNRPRLYRNGGRCEDFLIVRQPAGVIHLLGIESPGLTAAPALARRVYAMV